MNLIIVVSELLSLIFLVHRHPVILKIEYDEDYLALLKEFHGKIEAIDAINTMPFYDIEVGQSPLHPLDH